MPSAYIGGLDIGGSKIAATVANADGPLARVVAPTVKSGSSNRAPAEQCIALLQSACDQAGVPFGQINTVGVSSCGPFVKQAGLIHLVTPNICGGLSDRGDLPNTWPSVPLENVLREHFTTVVIENDCVAALAGERAFGNAQGASHCAYVTWSTGIGFGLCVDGNLLSGKNGNAGHAGHMLMSDQSSAQCGCGNYGDIEALISGRNLESQFGRSTEDLFDAARAGEAAALSIVSDAARWFGRALFNVTTTLDIGIFVVGGSVWQHHGDWLAPLVMHELETRLPALTAGVSWTHPALGIYVADVGALYPVLPQEWVLDWRTRKPWEHLPHSEN